MAVKLSSRQNAQIAYLETLPNKISRLHSFIEQLGAPKVDESVVRQLTRTLEEIKLGCQGLGLTNLAETSGLMVTAARRGGSMALKQRGLREQFASLKTNFDQALKAASLPEAAAPDAPAGGAAE